MATVTKETGRIQTVAADGTSYEVIELTDFIEVATLGSSRREWQPGLRSLMLRNGQNVNSLGNDEFEVVTSGLRLRKAK